MSKYGLQLRGAKPVIKAAAHKAPAVPAVFKDDEDEESVERELARQAAKQRSMRLAEQQQKQALEQDPNVFDYDGFYDDMKQNQGRPAQRQKEVKREPKYIQRLIEKAKVREREHDIIYERQLAKERAKDDHLYGDKDKFVTSGYKKKLAEQEKWLAEERLRLKKEEEEEVTKRGDMSDFYRNLTKNVAFGGGDSAASSAAVVKRHGDEDDADCAAETVKKDDKVIDEATDASATPKTVDEESKQAVNQQQQAPDNVNTAKRAEMEVEQVRKQREESARERYLARKKQKQV